MDIGFLRINRKKTLYLQIYQGFKDAIEQDLLLEQEQIPSIRSLAESLSVSKITVEKAYDQLYSEGYIEKNNRARYTVAPVALPPWQEKKLTPPLSPPKPEQQIRYNLASGEMDPLGFDFDVWRRYQGQASDKTSLLMGYGDPQGEQLLRTEIAHYLFRARGVEVLPHQIVVSANTQVLLGVLCSLLNRKTDQIAFEDPGFKHGRQVFLDYGYPVQPVPMGKDGPLLSALQESKANIIYLSPSHQFPTGTIMPIGQRSQLLRWAQEGQRLLIEDDYDSEFRYYGNPIPALKGLDRNDKVVYLGSFSKVLPPAIRVSYMVLPNSLLESFQARQHQFNQSASTMEQLALAFYLQDGELDRQIRRLRKLYQDKREYFLTLLHQNFGEKATIFDNQSGLFVVLEMHSHASAEKLKQKAEKAGIRIAIMRDYSLSQTWDQRIFLYFSGVPLGELEQAVALLQNAWFSP